jgi:hypothetical protein
MKNETFDCDLSVEPNQVTDLGKIPLNQRK